MTTINDVYTGIYKWIDLVINQKEVVNTWILSAQLKITGNIVADTAYGLTINGDVYNHTATAGQSVYAVLTAIKNLLLVDFVDDLNIEVVRTQESQYLNIYSLDDVFKIDALSNMSKVTIPIIQQHQNNPAASKTDLYITVGYRPTGGRKGQEEKQEVENVTPTDAGFLRLITQFEGMLEIREINGTGELLERLVTTFARQDAMDILDKYGVVIRNITNGPYPIPYTEGEKWVRASILEIMIGFAGEEVYQPGVIEEIEITGGTISGSVKDHNIVM